jgi:hypothetical protein
MNSLGLVIWAFKIALVLGFLGTIVMSIDLFLKWSKLTSYENHSSSQIRQSNCDPQAVLQNPQELVSNLKTKVLHKLGDDLEKPYLPKKKVMDDVAGVFEQERRALGAV